MSGKWVECDYNTYARIVDGFEKGKARFYRTVESEGPKSERDRTDHREYQQWVEDKPKPTADLIWVDGKVLARTYTDPLKRWTEYAQVGGGGIFTTSGEWWRKKDHTELVAVPKKEWDELVLDRFDTAAGSDLVYAWEALANE